MAHRPTIDDWVDIVRDLGDVEGRFDTSVQQRASFPSLNTSLVNGHHDDVAIEQHLEALKDLQVKSERAMKMAEQAMKEIEDSDHIITALKTLISDHVGDDVIVRIFKMKIEGNPGLGRKLTDMVTRGGSENTKKWKQDIETLRRNIIDMKHFQTAKMRQLQGITASKDLALDASAKIIRTQENRIEDLDAEAKRRPAQFEIIDADKTTEKKMKAIVQKIANLDEQSFPQRWSDLKNFMDEVRQHISAETKIEINKIIEESEEMLRQSRADAKGTLADFQVEVHDHKQTRQRLNEAKAEIAKTQQELRNSREETATVKSSVKIAERLGQEVRLENAKYKTTLSAKEDSIKQRVAELNELRKTIDDKDSMLDLVKEEQASLKQQQDKDALQQGGEVRIWKQRYDDLYDRLIKASSNERFLQNEVTSLRLQYKGLQDEERTKSNRAIVAETALNAERMRNIDLTERESQAIEMVSNLRAETQVLSATIAEVMQKSSDSANEIANLRDTIDQQRDDHNKSQNNLRAEQRHAIALEVERTQDAQQMYESQRQESIRIAKEHDKHVSLLNDQVQMLELNEDKRNTELQSLTTDRDATKAELDNLKMKHQNAIDKVNETEAMLQDLSEGISQDSEELRVLRATADSAIIARNTAQATKMAVIKSNEDFKKLILYHGFRVQPQLQFDVVRLLDRLRQYWPVSAGSFRLFCDAWLEQIPLDAPNMTGIALWMFSITDINKISLKTLTSFVQTRSDPNQLAFLEEALRNVTMLDTINHDQAMFLLRGLQLFWMSCPGISTEEQVKIMLDGAKDILGNLNGKLPSAPLINAYHSWLSDVIIRDNATTFGEHVLQHAPPSLKLGEGMSIYTDHEYVVVFGPNSSPFIREMASLHCDVVDDGDHFKIWVDGFPNAQAPMILTLDADDENTVRVEKLFEGAE